MASSGEPWDHMADDALFTIPSFVSADLTARCGVEALPSTDIALHARVEVLKRLREVDKAVEDMLGVISSINIDIYSKVRSSNPDKWATTTVSEATRLWHPKPSLIHFYATYKYMMRMSAMFVVPHDFTISQTFEVRPQSHIDRLQAITSWCRQKAGPIQRFADTAQRIMEFNDKAFVDSFRNLDPPSQQSASHTWTDDDKTILTFLVESLRPVRGQADDPYSLGQSHILKKVLPDVLEVNDAVLQELLQKLGVLSPWQDLSALRPDLRHLYDTASQEKNNEVVAKAFASPPPSASGPLGPMDLHRSDPLASVRHDFGDSPIFIIDDPDAEELDDGVSMESIPSEPGKYWVHVHVADVCAVLPPTHFLNHEARVRGETMYNYGKTYPLLPHALTVDSETGVSLGATGRPQRVLTFSMKLDTHGGLFGTTVRAGIIKNTRVITYDSVDVALGRPPLVRNYPFGDAPPQPPVTPLQDSEVKQLRILDDIAQGFAKKRFISGVFESSRDRGHLSGFSSTMPSDTMSPTLVPGQFRGFPQLQYSVSAIHQEDTGARSMIAELMKLACRTASLFCLEQNVPVVRRFSSVPTMMNSDSDMQTLLDMRTPNGYVPYHEMLRYVLLDSAAGYTLEPRGHFGLGIPDGEGYCRVTSPLRRHSDMVAHWQIHSALLRSNKPAFSVEWLTDFMPKMQAAERHRRRAKGQHEAAWHTNFLTRWIEDPARRAGKPNPLERLEGHVLTPTGPMEGLRGLSTEVSLEGLALRAKLENLSNPDLPSGARVELKVSSLRGGIRPLIRVELR